MKIVLVRHGRTDLPDWPWIRSAELGSWISAYNSAGITDDAPPMAALDVAGRCSVIVSSELLRSEQSAGRLVPKTAVIPDRLFREVGLPYTGLPMLKMPPALWALLFRAAWAFGFSENGESIYAFRERARSAAERLMSLASTHGSVLLAGHGLMNIYIARELLSRGWRGPARTKLSHWGVTEYTFSG